MRTFAPPAIGMFLFAAAVPLFAQTETGAQQAEEADADAMVCRRIPVTGSYTRHRRICMTESEWSEQTRRNRETARGSLGRTSLGDGRPDASSGTGCCH